MKISIFLSVLLTIFELNDAFAPSKSHLLKKRSFPTPLFSKPSEDSSKAEANHIHDSQMKDSLVSARSARILMPLSALVSQALLPREAFAKASSSQFDTTIKTYFPGSIPSNTVLLRAQSTLRKRQYLPYNTLLATSLSSDEVLNTPTSLVNLLRYKFSESKDGGIYSLGGLGGIPFAGDAGMYDLLSHAPEDGRVLILFGPQVGIDKDGKVGMVERIGTSKYGADEACGPVVRAYRNIISGKEATSSGFNLEEDYLSGLLKKMPLKEYQSKGGDDYAIAKVTENMYGIIADLIQKEVSASIAKKSDFWDRVTEVTMMGGIVINRGHGSGTEGGDDYFQPLMMKTLVKGGDVDLYKEVFGDLNTPVN